jgi:putative ABC transport system permease protein
MRKAIRDLQGERARSVSIVLALALGIAGFLAILSAYAILTRALNDGYRATNPAAAKLEVDRLDDDGVRAAAGTPGVRAAEGRRTVQGRVKAGPAEWRNLVLFARRDLATSRINTIALQSGAWPSGAGEVAIERDALQVARARVGDLVTVRAVDGQERALRVVGSIHDVGQAQARMENIVYGYVTLDALAALGEEPTYNELAITVEPAAQDGARVQDVTRAVAARLEQSGRKVARTDIPEAGQHPHAKIMGLLLLSIAAFGLLVLALSGTIVFNVLTALLAGQKRQIGVMKALGGTRLQIARVYLLEAGLLGVAAMVLALPVGVLGGRWFCRWMAGFLNFDIASDAVPPWVFGLVLVVGVGLPIVAASIPVWLGTRAPVREALSPSRQVRRVYGASIVDRALARIGGPSRVLLLALRNAERSRLRVALTVGTLTLSGVFFMSALNVRQSMIKTVDRLLQSQRADLSVTLAADSPIDAVERAARATAGVSAAEAWTVVDGELPAASAAPGRKGDATRAKLSVIGLPAQSRLIAFDLSAGQGLDAGGQRAVVNTELFEKLGRPAIGEVIRLQVGGEDVSLQLSGVAREPFTPPAAYVSRELLDRRANAGKANTLRIALASADSGSLEAAKTNVEASLEHEGIRALQANTRADRRFVFDEHMAMIYVFLIAVSCVVGGVGVLGLFTTFSLNVTERRREMGVLRAIGATPARVAQIVVAEGAVIGAAAWLLAALVARPLGEAIGNLLLGMMFRTASDIAVAIEPKGVVIWFVVSLAGSAIASLRPAWQASRMSVREALTYE